jgi:hypothetical protein
MENRIDIGQRGLQDIPSLYRIWKKFFEGLETLSRSLAGKGGKLNPGSRCDFDPGRA